MQTKAEPFPDEVRTMIPNWISKFESPKLRQADSEQILAHSGSFSAGTVHKDHEMLRSTRMELAIRIQVEKLPEGPFLATSDELPGFVAQGRTVAEALDIARDVARKLIEARRERDGAPNLPTADDQRDYTIVVAA
jgi:predicted RNase H-like HicB family nuclease